MSPPMRDPVRKNGTIDPFTLDSQEPNFEASVNGLYFNQDKVHIVAGRLADPHRADEVVVNELAADDIGYHVGQVLHYGFFSNAQLGGSSVPTTPAYKVINLHVVGIGVLNNDVVEDDVDQIPQMLMTPALTRQVLGCCITYAWSGLQLRGGAGAVGAVEREYLALLPPGDPYYFHVTSVVEAEAEQSIKPESVALGRLRVHSGVDDVAHCGTCPLAPVSARHRGPPDHALPGRRSRAHGGRRTHRRRAGDRCGIPGGRWGRRRALTHQIRAGARPGTRRRLLRLDRHRLGRARPHRHSRRRRPRHVLLTAPHRVDARHDRSLSLARGSAVATLSAPLPVAAATGTRFALSSGHGRSAVPVRSAIVGVVLAVTVVVTALTFGNSLNTLISHPPLYGWNWNAMMESNAGYGDIPQTLLSQQLRKDKDVAAFSGIYFDSLLFDGQPVPVIGGTPGATVAPPLLVGHGVEQPNQVVLGKATLAALHKRVGDTVRVSGGGRGETLTIVGEATLPAVGIGFGLHLSIGTGAVVDYHLIPQSARNIQGAPTNGPNAVFVRFNDKASSRVPLRGPCNRSRTPSTRRRVGQPGCRTSGCCSRLRSSTTRRWDRCPPFWPADWPSARSLPSV